MISENLLLEYSAQLESYLPVEIIFSEKQRADFYFQIKSGEIKMVNTNDLGKEFTQGIFADGESFGEPALFGSFKYPASAITIKASQIYKLPKKSFFKLLKNNPETHLKLSKSLSKKLYYKSIILNEITGHPPEHRILTLIDFLKAKEGISGSYKVQLTRQQIADLTGLRVETVIRAVKQLEVEKEIQIINRKVWR